MYSPGRLREEVIHKLLDSEEFPSLQCIGNGRKENNWRTKVWFDHRDPSFTDDIKRFEAKHPDVAIRVYRNRGY